MAEEPKVAAEECSRMGASGKTLESFSTKEVKLGALPVTRALPVRDKRMVGPWCFLDRFGPLAFTEEKPMDVAPHPHIGLQTVTWLLEGEIAHDDSLGCKAVVRAGGLNVMTSGRGIAHSEQTPAKNSRSLNGVQLWAALPETHRHMGPRFQSLDGVPKVESNGGVIQVFSGSLSGVVSPAEHYSELAGADVQVHAASSLELGLNPEHEHAVLVLSGDCALDRQPLDGGRLHYLGTSRSSVDFTSRAGARLLLIGGRPFGETVLMWWNFVARTPEEIAQARADWEARRRFGEVHGYRGPRLEAPELVRFARPEPVS